MKRAFLTLWLACVAGPALALSCLPHDPAQVYTQAAQSEDAFVVVLGTLHFDEGQLPQVDWANQAATPPSTPIPARMDGQALSAAGAFDHPFDRAITLDAQCFGPWCAGAQNGAQMLGFLRRDAGGAYTLTLTPCGGFGFADPAQAVVDQVLSCHGGGACSPRKFP